METEGASGEDLTVEEAFALWEVENTTEREREETLEAISEGVVDFKAGRTVDAFDIVERMRREI